MSFTIIVTEQFNLGSHEILTRVKREPPIQESGSAVLVNQYPVHKILDDPGPEICREDHSLPCVRDERPGG